MMTAFLFFIIFFVLACFSGLLSDMLLEKSGSEGSWMIRVSFGGCFIFVTGMIVCFGGALLAFSPLACICTAAAIMIGLPMTAVVVKRRKGIKIKAPLKMPSGRDIIWAVVAAALIFLQIAAVMLWRAGSTEVYRGIGTAVAVYDKGLLSAADPMMLFIGSLSSVMRIHPLTMFFTVLPATEITLYYICYLSVIRTVCERRQEEITAFIAVVLLNIWGYQSQSLLACTMLLKWFSTGSFIIHALLNTLAVFLIIYLRNRPNEEEPEPDQSEEWDMNRHKIINARNLAIGLAVLAVSLIGIVVVLNNKINRLYDATVNLQSDMNNRCAIYEFTPEGKTEGYLIRGSDGKLTFVGGGGAENAEALSQFLARYGTGIDTWYVYGEDDDNSGAMRSLIDSGSADADNVYVVNREEMKGLQ